MKYGVRKPNIKKIIKARTTGKVKRQVKKAVNPLYGKKGMGIVNDPKKAAYNAVYNRTTVGVTAANGNPAASSSTNAPQKKEYSANTYSVCGILMIVLGAVLALLGLILLLAVPVAGIIAIVFGVACVVIGRKYRKVAKERRANE